MIGSMGRGHLGALLARLASTLNLAGGDGATGMDRREVIDIAVNSAQMPHPVVTVVDYARGSVPIQR